MAEGVTDRVAKAVANAERDCQFLICPSCGTLAERRLRNCPNQACVVGNVRTAIAKEHVVSTEHVRAPRQSAHSGTT